MRRTILFFSVVLFVLCPFAASIANEEEPISFGSIADVLQQEELFSLLPQAHQGRILELVQVYEESDLVLTPIENMSPFRISSLAASLKNWLEFAKQTQLRFDLQKKQLEGILAVYLFRPAFFAEPEDADEVQAQFEGLRERVISESNEENTQVFIEEVFSGFGKGTYDDRTPLFKYPITDDSFEQLAKDIVSTIPYSTLDKPTDINTMKASTEIRGLVLKAYTDAIPEDVRKGMEEIYYRAPIVAEQKRLDKAIADHMFEQHEYEMRDFHKGVEEEHRVMADMIRFEEETVPHMMEEQLRFMNNAKKKADIDEMSLAFGGLVPSLEGGGGSYFNLELFLQLLFVIITFILLFLVTFWIVLKMLRSGYPKEPTSLKD